MFKRGFTLGAVACVLTAGCSVVVGDAGLTGGSGSCRKQASRVECRPIAELAPGSVGSGVALPWRSLPLYKIVGGFTRGRELVVAVRVHTTAPMGAVLGVDTTSGARRLISGWVGTAAGTTVEAGSGSELGDLRALALVGNGYIAHLWEGYDFHGRLMRIDPADGTVDLVDDIGASCPPAGGGSFWPSDSDPHVLSSTEVAIPIATTGQSGMARVSAGTCAPLELGEDGPFLFATSGSRLFVANTVSGAVGEITGADVTWLPAAGTLYAVSALAMGTDSVWLYRPKPSPAIVNVRLDDGARTTTELSSGPGGSLPSSHPRMWLHPDGRRLLLALDGAIVVADPASGDSRTLSY